MQEHQIIDRIKQLCAMRSWTYYRLAKESGITYSTLNTMIHKAYAPSLPTLIKLCDGFGISLSDFFSNDETALPVCKEDKEHLTQWSRLNKKEKESVSKYIEFLIQSR